MTFRENFKQWTLGRQLQFTFILSSFILVGILVAITRLQLDWLRDTMLDKTEDLVTDYARERMHVLAEEKSLQIKSDINIMMDYIYLLRDIQTNVLGLDGSEGPPIVAGDPVWHNEIPANLLTVSSSNSQTQFTNVTGVFYSLHQDDLSEEAKQIIERDAAMDKLYPIIYKNSYDAIYAGYEEDELFHFYPGQKRSASYTPLVREWYYKAKGDPGNVIVTEPYLDADSEQFMISISTALIDQERKVHGVVSTDVTLSSISSILQNLDVIGGGYILLISKGGMILTQPESWNDIGTTLRIFDTELTGLDEDLWADIQDTNIDEDELQSYKDINNTEYYFVRSFVKPYTNNPDAISHYLLVCAQKEEVISPVGDLEDDYEESYLLIFWIVVCGAIITFLAIAASIWYSSKKVSRQLMIIEKLFTKIVFRALFADVTRGISCEKVDRNKQGIEGLVDACLYKLEDFKKLESEFDHYDWGATRPKDHMIFSNWKNKIYPKNYFHSHPLPWRPELSKLGRIPLNDLVGEKEA